MAAPFFWPPFIPPFINTECTTPCGQLFALHTTGQALPYPYYRYDPVHGMSYTGYTVIPPGYFIQPWTAYNIGPPPGFPGAPPLPRHSDVLGSTYNRGAEPQPHEMVDLEDQPQAGRRSESILKPASEQCPIEAQLSDPAPAKPVKRVRFSFQPELEASTHGTRRSDTRIEPSNDQARNRPSIFGNTIRGREYTNIQSDAILKRRAYYIETSDGSIIPASNRKRAAEQSSSLSFHPNWSAASERRVHGESDGEARPGQVGVHEYQHRLPATQDTITRGLPSEARSPSPGRSEDSFQPGESSEDSEDDGASTRARFSNSPGCVKRRCMRDFDSDSGSDVAISRRERSKQISRGRYSLRSQGKVD